MTALRPSRVGTQPGLSGAPADASGAAEVRRSARSAAIGLVGAAANGAFGFVLTVVIVRTLGASGSGALFTVVGVVSIVGAVCCLGADTGLIWALPRRRGGAAGDAARLLLTAVVPTAGFAVLVAVPGYLAAPAVAGALFDGDSTDGTRLLRLAFAGVPVIVLCTVLLAAVRATREVGAYVGVQFLLVPITRPVLIAGTAALGGGVLAAFAGWLVPMGVAAAVALALVVRPLGLLTGVRLWPAAADWRTFWAFALPRAASVAIDASSMWVGVLLTAALAGQAEAGVFGAVGRYVLAGLLVMQGMRVAVAPQLSRLLGADRRAEAAEVYRRTSLWIVVLSWPAYLLLGVFAPAFLHLFGTQFRSGATPMAVLAAAMAVNVGVGLVQTVLLMSGNSRRHLLATVVGLAFNLVAAVVLIPRHGALGAAVAWSLGIVAENLAAALFARRALSRPLVTRRLVRGAATVTTGVAAACAVGVVVAGRDLPGLAVTLGVLVAGCAASLGSGRVRAAVRDVGGRLRPGTTQGVAP